MSEKPTITSYSVRIPGFPAWESDIETIEDAEAAQRRAYQCTGIGHVLVANWSDGRAEIIEPRATEH